MDKILYSKETVDFLKRITKIKVNSYRRLTDKEVRLVIFQIGDNPASNIYIRNKEKYCKEVGILSETIRYTTKDYDKIYSEIEKYILENGKINYMLQLPLPEDAPTGFEKRIFSLIEKYGLDPDCLTNSNLGKVFTGENLISPCTAEGIIDLLELNDIQISGRNACIVGRSNIVGRPVAALLLNKDATVTVCHSKTKNLEEITRNADILIVAVGKPKFITAGMVKDGAVVIDVGINRDENGKLCGDVDFEAVKNIASIITPVPGGVGPMTVAELAFNSIVLTEQEGEV